MEPPQATRYEITNGQVEVPSTAADRRGIQPVVDLKVNDDSVADVSVDESITFHVHA